MSDHTNTAFDTDYDWNDKMQDEGTWDRIKGKAREKWGELTDDEMDEARGNWEQFKGRIKQKTGETADNVEAFFRKHF